MTNAPHVDYKFEIAVIPVSDVDRAKAFYTKLGWRLDADFAAGDDWRVIQFTPPGSNASVIFGKNVTPAAPGSAQGLYLIVSDIASARAALTARGVEIGEIFHGGDVHSGTDTPYISGRRREKGPDPARGSYRSFASFSDPDGNGWLLQEITTRLPDAWTATRASTRHAILQRRSGARLPPMARMRSGPAATTTTTGRTGTPTTSSRNRRARRCPCKQAR